MKQSKMLLFLPLILTLILLVGCNNSTLDKNISNLTMENTSEVYYTSDESVSTLLEHYISYNSLNVDYVTNEYLNKYDIFDEFVDYDTEQKIIFYSDTKVKDFKYIELSNNFYDDFGITYTEEKILFSIDELLPEKPFVVSWMEIGDIVSYRGVAFTDENNITKYFYIADSGKDKSLSLIEF